MRRFSTFFWICSALFLLNQLVEFQGLFIPYVHAYLDDLLTAGIVLGFALFIQQQLVIGRANYTFSWAHAILFVFWYALLFEWLFPKYDAAHYSDPWDIVAYAIGAIFFMLLGNKAVSRCDLYLLIQDFAKKTQSFAKGFLK